jgi:hypothetical protein
MTKIFRKFIFLIVIILAIPGAYTIYRYARMFMDETKVLNQVIDRLQADSRIAEVLVTNVKYDEEDKKFYTTIKFVEYGVDGNPGEPKYFTFAGNIIQFQSLVIRFDDIHIRNADKLREKSAYLFWKVFMLDGSDTQEFEITKINQVPEGYRIEGADHPYEDKLWSQFWKYALDPETASSMGIKNAQIEAPGTMFLPSVIYTIRIEHDGGLRIDSSPIPFILKGEKIRK